MSRTRVLVAGMVAAVLVLGTAACSDDGDGEGSSNDRAPISFSDPPEGSTELGLCRQYEIGAIKDLLGGDESFKRLPPAAIGAPGDPVSGEVCAWERAEESGDVRTLTIEGRKYADPAALDAQFAALEEATLEAEPVAALGDDAFSSTSEETTLLQIRTGGYLLTLASRGTGELEPIDVDTLKLLSAAGLEQLT